MCKVVSLEEYRTRRAQQSMIVSCLQEALYQPNSVSYEQQQAARKRDIKERNADVIRQLRIEEDDSW